jgi:hypothetical protein
MRSNAPTSSSPSFSPGHRWKVGLNVAASIMAMVVIVVMVNFLAARHFRRFQWSSDSRFRLSRVTTEVLHSLTNKVKVIVFFDRTKPLYDLVSDLLDQYRLQCPNLEIEHVDYERSPGRAKLIQAEYALSSADEGDRVIFDAGGRRRMVYAKDLSEYDYNALLKGKVVKMTGFKGEQLFTSALYSLLDGKPLKAYFLTGHDEHDPTDADDQNGYLKFGRILQESQIALGRLDLLNGDIPADCQLLVIANPHHALAQDELKKIDGYLNQGGRLFLLLGRNSLNEKTGLEQLLEENWGVKVGKNFVYDRTQANAGDTWEVVVTHFANHAIVNPLSHSRLLLIVPRSVSAASKAPQGADAPKVAELATTGPDGVASLGAGRIERQGAMIPLMVAVEKGAIQGISADRGITRIVVVGESQFLANAAIEYDSNRDFARNAVNWLLNRDLLVQGIGTRPITEYRISMTAAEYTGVRWLFLAGFPGGVLLVGGLVWLRRRG